jgi:hypothetical protein
MSKILSRLFSASLALGWLTGWEGKYQGKNLVFVKRVKICDRYVAIKAYFENLFGEVRGGGILLLSSNYFSLLNLSEPLLENLVGWERTGGWWLFNPPKGSETLRRVLGRIKMLHISP